MTLDGSWVDISTIGIAILSGFHRPFRNRMSACKSWECKLPDMMTDALHGAAVMPFILLIGSVAFTEISEKLVESEKVYFALGGIVGLLAIGHELLKAKPPTLKAP